MKLIKEKRNLLGLFVTISQSVEKIEKLLGLDKNDELVFRNDMKSGHLIERVSNQFNRINLLVLKGKNYPLVQNMRKRIVHIENIIETALKKLFQQGIKSKDQDLISNCLRTFQAIDKTSTVEDFFREQFVHPFSLSKITNQNLENRRGGFAGLENVLNELINFVPTLLP